jgi:predicted acylesterase/phospholipase RssA
MKILIVGSIRHLDDQEPVKAACREIGRALASNKHKILVGSDSSETVDRYIVEGANSIPGPHEVMIYRPPGEGHDGPDDTKMPFAEGGNLPNLKFSYFYESGPWTVAHTAAIRDSDGVLIIGGGGFTELIGQITPILGKPLLPIPIFGGAASSTWARLAYLYLPNFTQQELQNITLRWTASSALEAVSALEKFSHESPFRNHYAENRGSPTRILSLSGGGIRGIFQARYLEVMEQQLGRPLRDCFHLIAGTSTGAIIALGISLGISTTSIVKLFENHGGEIFPESTRKKSQRLIAWLQLGPRYSQAPLRQRLTQTFRAIEEARDNHPPTERQLTLKECNPPVMIAATTLDQYQVRNFSTVQRAGLPVGRDGDLHASEVALSSAAAPLFFPAVKPQGVTTYVDGGVWANNPVLMAVTEIHRHWGTPFSEMRVISIGNGEIPGGQVGVDFNRMRRARMISPILDMMFATQSELADRTTAYLLKDEDMTGRRMLRVNVNLAKPIDLDDAKEALKLLPLADTRAVKDFEAFKRIVDP